MQTKVPGLSYNGKSYFTVHGKSFERKLSVLIVEEVVV